MISSGFQSFVTFMTTIQMIFKQLSSIERYGQLRGGSRWNTSVKKAINQVKMRGLLNYFRCLFSDWLQHARQIWTEIDHFFYQKLMKKSWFYKKSILNFDVFRGVKVIPFPEGINQLFVLYPVFLWKAQSDIPDI